MEVDVIVTRHPALVQYLKYDCNLDFAPGWECVTHVAPEQEIELLSGKVVAGVLPLHLAALCEAVIVPTIIVPPELRGMELTLTDLRNLGVTLETYKVSKV